MTELIKKFIAKIGIWSNIRKNKKKLLGNQLVGSRGTPENAASSTKALFHY